MCNRLNLIITTRLNRRRDTQHEQKKSHTTSHDLKNRRIVKVNSIDKTLLIEQCWVKSHDEVTCGKIIGYRGIEKMVDSFLSLT